jgi:hypothetical protein
LAIRRHRRDTLLAVRNVSRKEVAEYSFCFSTSAAATHSQSAPLNILEIDGPGVVFVSRQFKRSKLRVVFMRAKMIAFKIVVGHGIRFRILARMSFLSVLAGLAGGMVCAQEPPPPPQQPPAPSVPLQQEASKNLAAPCVQPAPMVRWEDYNGPLGKLVGTFARPLERKAVPLPHYKPGLKLCTLKLKDKFALFVQDSLDPVAFLGAGFDAGIDQAENTDPSYGQGAQGYGRRFGAELAGQTSSRFLKDFAYPAIFSEDTRYYRLGRGPAGKRLRHAMEHVVVAQRDDTRRMFNFSEWLGTASTVALNNTYHPDYQRGFSPAAQRVGYNVLQDMGFDVLREFWPEISRKFRLPFRGEPDLVSHDSNPASK